MSRSCPSLLPSPARHVVRSYFTSAYSGIRSFPAGQQQIYHALREGNAEPAQAAMREQLNLARTVLLRQVGALP